VAYFWGAIYFLITHLLICAWVKYDAKTRMINSERWYRFCLFVPVIGVVFYGITKQARKLWTLTFTFWIFTPAVYFGIKYLVAFIKAR